MCASQQERLIDMFHNFKALLRGATFEIKLKAAGNIITSALAVAFIAAAFSDYIPALPDEITALAGGTVGALIGGAKIASS
ncbi:MAG: hypothetical protein AAF675_01600 [Pseudomonadota bacterium]